MGYLHLGRLPGLEINCIGAAAGGRGGRKDRKAPVGQGRLHDRGSYRGWRHLGPLIQGGGRSARCGSQKKQAKQPSCFRSLCSSRFDGKFVYYSFFGQSVLAVHDTCLMRYLLHKYEHLKIAIRSLVFLTPFFFFSFAIFQGLPLQRYFEIYILYSIIPSVTNFILH